MNTTRPEDLPPAGSGEVRRDWSTSFSPPMLRQKPVQDAPPLDCAAATRAARCGASDSLETQARTVETFTLPQS